MVVVLDWLAKIAADLSIAGREGRRGLAAPCPASVERVPE